MPGTAFQNKTIFLNSPLHFHPSSRTFHSTVCLALSRPPRVENRKMHVREVLPGTVHSPAPRQNSVILPALKLPHQQGYKQIHDNQKPALWAKAQGAEEPRNDPPGVGAVIYLSIYFHFRVTRTLVNYQWEWKILCHFLFFTKIFSS